MDKEESFYNYTNQKAIQRNGEPWKDLQNGWIVLVL
jgi:hypothetical protein